MKTLGFAGTVRLGKDALGRAKATLHPHEVIKLPPENAEQLLRSNHLVCDLTISREKAPYGALVPQRTVRRYG